MNTKFQVKGFTAKLDGTVLYMESEAVEIAYDMQTGLADIYRAGSTKPTLQSVWAETDLDGKPVPGTVLKRDAGQLNFEEFTDVHGRGIRVVIENKGEDVSINQNFLFYPSQKFIMLESAVIGNDISTNYIAPIVAKTMDFGDGSDVRFLAVPFDNDNFVRYASVPLSEADMSYSVTTVFDNDTRRSFVVGAVTFDAWKTGIKAVGGGLRVFGGISDESTRDVLPHGTVKGNEIFSPKIFLGFFDDWRDGLETYGKAVGAITPPLPWDAGPPFGWNSWSAVASKIDYDIYAGASDFLKNSLTPNSFHNNGVVYVIFDSFWTNLTEEELKSAAQYAKLNGQKPGIYWTPFAYWGDPKKTSNPVEGTDGKYVYHDILLKDFEGNYLPKNYNGMSIDPTHPGNLKRMEHMYGKFIEWGFEYVKLDFLSHGSREGAFHNPDITTGVQAYNFGMRHMVDFLGEKLTKQEFFISLSIAPIFPGGQYSHARRISCDVFGTINWAEYMLNSLSYGWWLHDAVYTFNDPDHIVVYNSYNHREAILYNEGLTRYISTAIGGPLMLDSEDFRQDEAKERAMQILTNERVNQLAAEGVTFRPVEGNTGDRAANVFVRHDDQVLYVAVFNFSNTERLEIKIDPYRVGLDPAKKYEALCMISGKTQVMDFNVKLEPAEPKLFKIAAA